jgi:hypothetical protein
MIRQINCKHYLKESKKTSVYTYKLINAELNICKNCERKLRKQILEQDKIEKEIKQKYQYFYYYCKCIKTRTIHLKIGNDLICLFCKKRKKNVLKKTKKNESKN